MVKAHVSLKEILAVFNKVMNGDSVSPTTG